MNTILLLLSYAIIGNIQLSLREVCTFITCHFCSYIYFFFRLCCSAFNKLYIVSIYRPIFVTVLDNHTISRLKYKQLFHVNVHGLKYRKHFSQIYVSLVRTSNCNIVYTNLYLRMGSFMMNFKESF
jgi:hypothetical protein